MIPARKILGDMILEVEDRSEITVSRRTPNIRVAKAVYQP